MTVKRLTAQQASVLLKDFYEKWGPEQMERSYGWKQVPRQLVPGERFYAFWAGDVLVGWGSMILNTRDAEDEAASVSTGVFPEHQRQGHHTAIIGWLCDRAKKLGALRATRIVYKSNPVHYERVKRLCQDPASGWTYAGDIWYPAPGYGYFVKELLAS